MNAGKYARAQDKIASGDWRVDADAGQVYNRSGRRIGSVMSNGYVFLVMSPDGTKGNQNAYAHRVVWESVHGELPPGMQVNHINGDKTDNRIANLEAVTGSGNCQHAHSTGLASGAQPGEAHHSAKLSGADVQDIRARVAAGAMQRDLAAEYGVSKQQVSRIVRGLRWSAPV